ncbi:MAG: DUF4291 domain-containing protein [Actinomycetaceae bacterium]|nr:DUF4291 domain-containing protein [Actinomycetaceae bacterium]
MSLYEIRADFNADTIVMYQAYSPAIADAALAAGRFVAPFSFKRMTWLKPSFTWLMHRSNWGRKAGQERILAVRITRAGFEEALGQAVLTDAHPARLAESTAHVQWDPERNLRGAALNHYSIQVGISRHLIEKLVNEWIVEITDLTQLTRKTATLVHGGRLPQAKRLLPSERIYPLPPVLKSRLTPG